MGEVPERVMGELQTLWSCSLRSPSSVSKALKRSPENWVSRDSRVLERTAHEERRSRPENRSLVATPPKVCCC
jgi:hypothetical protein